MRSIRAGVAALAVLLLAAGCTEQEPVSTPPSPPPVSSSPLRVAPETTAGSDGLTVRYLAPDGTIKTLPVADFPR